MIVWWPPSLCEGVVMATQVPSSARSVVVELDGLHWASEKYSVEAVLGRRPGVVGVEANPVAQTATATYDPSRTTVEDLAGWVRDCGYHCRGESVPDHLCPMTGPATGARDSDSSGERSQHEGHPGHDMDAMTTDRIDRKSVV